MLKVYFNGQLIKPQKVSALRVMKDEIDITLEPNLKTERLARILIGISQNLKENIESVLDSIMPEKYEKGFFVEAIAHCISYAANDFYKRTNEMPTDLIVTRSPVSIIVANDNYGGYYKFVMIIDADNQIDAFVICEPIQFGRIVYFEDSIAIADSTRTILLENRSREPKVIIVTEKENDLLTVNDLILSN